MIPRSGIAVPIEYESVIKNAERFKELVAARVMTDASIGPTHGAHNNPRLSPISTPPTKLVSCEPFGSRLASLEKKNFHPYLRFGYNHTDTKESNNEDGNCS